MIFFLHNEKLACSEEVPRGYEQDVIHGMAALSCMHPSAGLFMQHVRIGQYRLVYVIVTAGKTAVITINEPMAVGCIAISLEGKWNFRLPPLATTSMPEGHANLFYFQHVQGELFFEASTESKLCLLLCAREQLMAVAGKQSLLEFFYATVKSNESAVLFQESPLAAAPVMEAAFQLTRSSYYPFPLAFHTNLANGLVLALLKQAATAQRQLLRFAIEDLDAIHSARSLIDNRLYHHFTLEEIAREVGINRQKLGVGFKALFGKGLYEYLLDQRLLYAKQQLEDTRKPIKEIAAMTGYRNASNFCTAIKKRFGRTAKSLRREQHDA